MVPCIMAVIMALHYSHTGYTLVTLRTQLTVLDGYPCGEKERVASLASAPRCYGWGSIGMICLVFSARCCRLRAPNSPAEYCLTALLALSLIAAVVQAPPHGLIAQGWG